MSGKPVRCRRSLYTAPGRQCPCEIDFFPLYSGQALLAVLGKLQPLPEENRSTLTLPDKILALRDRQQQRYFHEQWQSMSSAWTLVGKQVHLAAQARCPVLLVGERGCGKQWLARAIHYRDATRHGPFACLDCARLPAAALAKSLAGDGAAIPGAPAGTLFIKEVQELPRDLQRRLCDLMADESSTAPRIIAGCTTDAATEVRVGRIIDDLYCALAVFTIVVPPLRERIADLPALVGRMMERTPAAEASKAAQLTAAALDTLGAYAWPGNLAELLEVLRRARAQAQAPHIDVDHLPAHLRREQALTRTGGSSPQRPLPLDSLLEQVERRLIVLALRQSQGNKTRAAELLSIWRPRLLRRMQSLGIADPEAASGKVQLPSATAERDRLSE
jgi:DNA-binding NtrC family response regulator